MAKILAPVFMLIYCVVFCSCTGPLAFQLNKNFLNKKMTGYGILEPEVIDLNDCARHCFYYRSCKSIDFHKNGPFCKLNEADSTSVGDAEFETEKGAIFSDILDWPRTMAGHCGKRPCSENQRCVNGKDGFVCVNIKCPDHFAPIDNGEEIRLSAPGKMSYQATATVTCKTGYKADKPLITCQLSGRWEGATCKRQGAYVGARVRAIGAFAQSYASRHGGLPGSINHFFSDGLFAVKWDYTGSIDYTHFEVGKYVELI